MAGESIDDILVKHYPVLYHMTSPDAWETIQRLGLLSTSRLLDLFEVHGPERAAIEEARRPESVRLEHPMHGSVVIRDNKPLSIVRLEKCLVDMTVPEYLKMLNSRVFFWLHPSRLQGLRDARAYREQEQLILQFDTRRILEQYRDHISLSVINSGATVHTPPPRGSFTFQRLDDFDYEASYRKRGQAKAIAELVIEGGVTTAFNMILGSSSHCVGHRGL